MKKEFARWTVAVMAFIVLVGLSLAISAPVLAQDVQADGGKSEFPSELREKYRDLKEALADLHDSKEILGSDVKEYKLGVAKLRRKARSLSPDERRDLRDRANAARDEYSTTVEEKLNAVKENGADLKKCMATAREAWKSGDIDTALSKIDESLAKIADLQGQAEDLHQTFQQILDLQRQLLE